MMSMPAGDGPHVVTRVAVIVRDSRTLGAVCAVVVGAVVGAGAACATVVGAVGVGAAPDPGMERDGRTATPLAATSL